MLKKKGSLKKTVFLFTKLSKNNQNKKTFQRIRNKMARQKWTSFELIRKLLKRLPSILKKKIIKELILILRKNIHISNTNKKII